MMKPMVVIKTTLFNDAKLKVPSSKILKKDADLTIQFKDHKIRIHKAVLTKRCSYFRAMLKSNLQESINDEVNLEDAVDFKTFKLLVFYLYTGLIEISTDNLEAICQAASYFQLDNLKEFCSIIFTQNVDTTTVDYIHNFAQQHYMPVTSKAAFEFKVKHFETIWRRGDFLLWPFESIKEVVRSDLVVVTEEKKVLRFVVEWLNFASINHRDLYTDDLLQSMRYTYLTRQDIVESTTSQLVDRCTQKASEFCGKITPPRQYHKGIYICGIDSKGLQKFQRYWPIDGSVKDLRLPKMKIDAIQCVVHNERIYLLDDNLFGATSNSVCNFEMYDPLQDQWTSLAPMKCRHTGLDGCSHTCCSFENKIYVFRTTPGEQYISTAVYSIKTNSWKYNKHAYNNGPHLGTASAVNFGESIYLNEYSFLFKWGSPKLYQYKPSTKKWTNVPIIFSVHEKDIFLCHDKMVFIGLDQDVVVFNPISHEIMQTHVLPGGWDTSSLIVTSFDGAIFGFSDSAHSRARQNGKFLIKVERVNPLACSGELKMLSARMMKTTMTQIQVVTSIE